MRQSPAPLIPLSFALMGAALGCKEVAPSSAPTPTPTVTVAGTAPSVSVGSPPASARADAPDAAAGAKPAKDGGPRVYARARFAWIHPSPSDLDAWIGYLSRGGSAPLRGGSLEAARVVIGRSRCKEAVAIEPRGYVCLGHAATLDADDPLVRELQKYGPDRSSPWPYAYGESLGAPRYVRLPTHREQQHAEWYLDEHLARVMQARALEGGQDVAAIDKALVGVDLRPAGLPAPTLIEVDETMRDPHKWIANGSTVAYTTSFDAEDRTFLVAADLVLIPKDRVRPYPRSTFEGLHLGSGVELPLAFFRKKDRPKYRRQPDGTFATTGESWPAKTWVALADEEVTIDKETYVRTRDDGTFVRASEASIVRAATQAPFDLRKDGADARTWVDVSVLGGTLVAYEGLKPVFATLISPGRGGVPFEGHDVLETASTPTGIFRVDGKFITATMVSSSDENFVHTEVQYVQNFHGPHALHGAYWHDEWGLPKSGGCVNLSPIDSKWLFEWSDPKLPDGWYGVRSTRDFGWATVVDVHR